MKRIVLLSAAVLFASLGADGTPAGLCGQGMEPAEFTEELTDGGGAADAGGTPDLSPPGGSSGKVLHLINTVTGEDLGILADLRTLTVFSAKLNVLIELGTNQPTTGTYIYFSKAACAGNRYVAQATSPSPALTNLVFILGAQASYLQQVGGVVPVIHVFSRLKQADPTKLDGSVLCENIDTVFNNQLIQFVDTAVKVRPPDNQLKVELR